MSAVPAVQGADALSTRQLNEVLRCLMTWGFPAHMDWPLLARQLSHLAPSAEKDAAEGAGAAGGARSGGANGAAVVAAVAPFAPSISKQQGGEAATDETGTVRAGNGSTDACAVGSLTPGDLYAATTVQLVPAAGPGPGGPGKARKAGAAGLQALAPLTDRAAGVCGLLESLQVGGAKTFNFDAHRSACRTICLPLVVHACYPSCHAVQRTTFAFH